MLLCPGVTGRSRARLAGELGSGREQVAQRRAVAVQVAQFDEGAGRSPVQQRRGAGRGVTGVAERVEPFGLGGEVAGPVADVVHPAGLRHVQRGAGDGLPDLDGERPAEGEGDVAFHRVGPAGRVGERQLPHPGRAPAQPEDLTEFLLALVQVGDRDPDVPDASHDELLSGRFVRFYDSSMRTARPLFR